MLASEVSSREEWEYEWYCQDSIWYSLLICLLTVAVATRGRALFEIIFGQDGLVAA